MYWKKEIRNYLKVRHSKNVKKTPLNEKLKIVHKTLKEIEKELQIYHKRKFINARLRSSNIISFDYGGLNELRYQIDIDDNSISFILKKGGNIETVNKTYQINEVGKNFRSFILKNFVEDFVLYFKTK